MPHFGREWPGWDVLYCDGLGSNAITTKMSRFLEEQKHLLWLHNDGIVNAWKINPEFTKAYDHSDPWGLANTPCKKTAGHFLHVVYVGMESLPAMAFVKAMLVVYIMLVYDAPALSSKRPWQIFLPSMTWKHEEHNTQHWSDRLRYKWFKEKKVDLHCFAKAKDWRQSCGQEHDRFLQAGEEME